MITIKECEEAIGIPTADWVSRCHEIANAILRAGLVKGESRYGLYLGSIARTSYFAGRKLTRHGWIELDDGGIFDPTRWVFEDVDPYIFVCEKDDERVEDYDIGASSIRVSTNSEPPDYSGESLPGKQVKFPDVVEPFLLRIFGRTDPCKRQCFWLANQAPDLLDILAKPIYQAFIDADHGAWVPIDFRHVAVGGEY